MYIYVCFVRVCLCVRPHVVEGVYFCFFFSSLALYLFIDLLIYTRDTSKSMCQKFCVCLIVFVFVCVCCQKITDKNIKNFPKMCCVCVCVVNLLC